MCHFNRKSIIFIESLSKSITTKYALLDKIDNLSVYKDFKLLIKYVLFCGHNYLFRVDSWNFQHATAPLSNEKKVSFCLENFPVNGLLRDLEFASGAKAFNLKLPTVSACSKQINYARGLTSRTEKKRMSFKERISKGKAFDSNSLTCSRASVSAPDTTRPCLSGRSPLMAVR